jgi:outer membrane protein assembly factor BamA
VNVQLVDSLLPQQAVGRDSAVRVLVQVQEGPRHQVRTGLGYATIECFRVQTGWTAHDFLGAARTLDLTARLSKLGAGTPRQSTGLSQFCNPFSGTWTIDTLNYSLGATLRQPAFLSRSNVGTIGFVAERRSEFGIYTRQATGGSVDLTVNARGAVPVTFGYSYSYGKTSASDAVFCVLFRLCDSTSRSFLRDPRSFGAVTVTLARDRVNNALDPSEGSLITATLLHASRLVFSGSLYEFNRGEIEFAKYYPIGRRTVFAWRARGGTILPKKITLQGQSVRYVPPDQRFYGGGPNSVRGYGRNELGPRVYVIRDTIAALDPDATAIAGAKVWRGVFTAPTGGNTAVILNGELRFPSPIFAQRMRLGLFVDAGQVWERGQELVTIRDVRVTPGAGGRFTTPLGPVRIDAAYNGYQTERGPLLLIDSTGNVQQIRASYPPLRTPKRFFQKVIVQIAVGQAF